MWELTRPPPLSTTPRHVDVDPFGRHLPGRVYGAHQQRARFGPHQAATSASDGGVLRRARRAASSNHAGRAGHPPRQCDRLVSPRLRAARRLQNDRRCKSLRDGTPPRLPFDDGRPVHVRLPQGPRWRGIRHHRSVRRYLGRNETTRLATRGCGSLDVPTTCSRRRAARGGVFTWQANLARGRPRASNETAHDARINRSAMGAAASGVNGRARSPRLASRGATAYTSSSSSSFGARVRLS